MKYLAALLVAFIAVPAWAQLAKTVHFEQTLEQRIFRQVQSVDPNAQVMVKLKLKESKMALPGVGFDYFGAVGVDEIQAEDIQAIDIKIVSTISPFPDWLVADIRARHGIGRIVPNVVTQQFEPETLKVIRERDPISQTADRIFTSMRESLPRILAVLGVVVAVVMTGFALLVGWMISAWRSQVARLLGALDNRSEGAHTESAAARDSAGPAALSGDTDSLDLPAQGLVELLADCYWTENDGYARWVWDHLSNEQRQTLIKEWEPMEDYAKFLRKQESRAQDHHQHPYYLNPLALRACNQKDLADAAKKEKGLWPALPPMRQESLDMPLETKVRLAETQGQVRWTPKAQSKPRSLAFVVSWGHLTEADELLLWQDSRFIPSHLWKTLNTLVWVARLELEQRRELLNRFSAQELAQCWVGPSEVLDRVREALPEKKLKLVESYAAGSKPRRGSVTFARLSSEAAGMLATVEDSNGQKAA